MKWTKTTVLLMGLCLMAALPAATATAQEPPQEPSVGGTPRPSPTPPTQDPQLYEKVITKDANSQYGIFDVHQVKEKYYYEIPKKEFNKEFLYVTSISRSTLGVGYGGQLLSERVVRWERHGNKVHLRNIDYSVVADANKAIAQAVRAANNDTILMTFPVVAWGLGDSAVIEVGRLFTTDVFEFSARQWLSATTLDTSRSYVERISPYQENIEAEASHTYTRTAPSGAASATVAASGMRPGSASLVLHHSMLKLPEKPMTPRLFDERVGYNSVSQMDYGRDKHKAPRRRYITRWRLRKKDPGAAISEPVKPIVYWIDSATPTKWIPYMRRGVEKWQKAFEAAGFKNAIIAKLAPAPEQDPDFSPEDARYSVVRWLPTTVENAWGHRFYDPRTGEILAAGVGIHHNVMNLLHSWYFLQAGPLDRRAAKLPLPDDLMGTLLEYFLAHEVGHTLGFQHNEKASSTYPQEKVRDREWVRRMGHTPSVMDYSRFNYVAQPEDRIEPVNLVPGVGPYDVWATMWGYKPIPDARTPDEEWMTLDEWARQQEQTPWYRFSTTGAAGSDPGQLNEAVGDADAVRSTALGIKNLHRVAKMLLQATTTEKGEPYEDLDELYGRMFGQWTLELNHVAAIVGGFDTQQKHIGQQGVRFTPVPKVRQTEAVRFLNENAFATPTWAIDKEILRRIEPMGSLNRVRNAQSSVLNNLLSGLRFARMVEQQALDGDNAYQVAELLADVRKGVWKELDAPLVKIDAYRRNLQRAYLDLANNKLNAPPQIPPPGLPASFHWQFARSGEERPFYRAELRALNSSVNVALNRTTDRATKVHLNGVRDQITKILDPKFAAGAGSAETPTRFNYRGEPRSVGLDEQNRFSGISDTCWPDYVIRP